MMIAVCCLILCSCGSRDEESVRIYEEALAGEAAKDGTFAGEPGAGNTGGVLSGEPGGGSLAAKPGAGSTDGTLSGEPEAGTPLPDTSEEACTSIYVYVCGCVAFPGVYEFQPGARCYEAVEEAGGFTGEADSNRVNLASPMTDGQKLYIPALGEMLTQQEAGDGQEAAQMGREAGEDANDGTLGNSSGRVNINTASEAELMTLPGIGQSRARSIIAYREARGGFKSTEEIQQIDGIKEKVYSKLRDFITIE